MRKQQSKKHPSGFHSISVTEPFEILHLDIVGPVPQSRKGNRYILVAIDHLNFVKIQFHLLSFQAIFHLHICTNDQMFINILLNNVKNYKKN